MPEQKKPLQSLAEASVCQAFPHMASSSTPAQRRIKERNKTDHQSQGHKAERAEMKAAVAMGKQTSTVKVSGGAMSMPTVADGEERRHGRPREVRGPFFRSSFWNASLLCRQEAHRGETQQMQ